jgi:hypothetical protein
MYNVVLLRLLAASLDSEAGRSVREKNQRANERTTWTSSADKNIDPQVNWG